MQGPHHRKTVAPHWLKLPRVSDAHVRQMRHMSASPPTRLPIRTTAACSDGSGWVEWAASNGLPCRATSKGASVDVTDRTSGFFDPIADITGDPYSS